MNEKPRIDAWDAALSEEQRWAVYEKSRRLPWHAVAAWAQKEFGLGKAPGRSAFYGAIRRLRKAEHAHHLEEAALARKEAGELADKAGAQRATADAFRALAADVALRTGDAETAAAWVKMSAQLVSAAQRDAELKLRAEAQKLDREKFEAAQRRLAAVAEAADAARDGKVDPERLADEIDRILGRKK